MDPIALKELIDGLESQEDVLVDSLNILPEKEDKKLRYLNNKPRRIYFDPSKKLPF